MLGGFARALALALIVTGMLGFASVSAQDATPTAVECYSPGLPPGTPTPEDEMAGMEMASPEAAASPAAVEPLTPPVLPEGQPADEETALAINATIENYAACTNLAFETGDPSLFVALETQHFAESQGYATPYDRIAEETAAPFVQTVEIQSIEDPLTYDDGRISGDAQLLINGTWIAKLRFFLVQDGLLWKIDEQAYLQPTPPGESVSVNGIQIVETTDEATGEVTYEFVSTVGSFDYTAAENLVLNFANTGVELHEAVVVQLPEGADPLGLLDGSVAFEDIRFLGGVFDIYPGTTQDAVFENLAPGSYTILCFFPSPDGVPHAARGMIATFNVLEPAE